MASERLRLLGAMERTMKAHEVILRVMSGQLKWYQAAEILGVSSRQMRRWRARYEKHGVEGLRDNRKIKISPKRIPFETAEKVLQLYREKYSGFNVLHFHEELKETHKIKISYTGTKNLLQESGLVTKEKKRGKYFRRRERKPLTGMLLHLDGSEHRWFEHNMDQRQSLIAIIDDADSRCLSAGFYPEEGTREVLEVIHGVVQKHGTFVSLYTDRAGHFVYTPAAGGPPDRNVKTQVEQVLDDLGIELIVARTPQARGRGERAWGTMQGRLPQELKLANITSYEAANRYLNQVFIPKYNRKFSVAPGEEGSAFIRTIGINLKRIFARRYERTVEKDNTIQFQNRRLQLPKITGVSTLAKRKVEIREHLDGILEVLRGTQLIAEFPAQGTEAADELMTSAN